MKHFVFALILALVFTGCAQHGSGVPTTPITKVAKAIDDTAAGLKAVQTAVIQANSSGLIDVPTTSTILTVCATINGLGLQASALVRASTTGAIPPGILPILQQMAAGVNADLQRGVLSIKDQKTLNLVEGIVATVQTGLAAAVIVAGGQ